MEKVDERIDNIIDIIANIIENEELGCYEDDDYIRGEFDYQILDTIKEKIDPEVKVTNGASKMVIIPSFGDLVIKIPLVGAWYLSDNGYYDENDEWVEGDEEEYVFETFSGAGEGDYCATEVEMYDNFVEDTPEYAFLFPETKFYKIVKGTKFYLQTKCGTNICYYQKVEISDNSHKIGKELFENTFIGNEYWVELLVEKIGGELAKKALEFIDDNISDLHSGNLGIDLKTNMPQIIDFSGFWN